jgi:protein TonB
VAEPPPLASTVTAIPPPLEPERVPETVPEPARAAAPATAPSLPPLDLAPAGLDPAAVHLPLPDIAMPLVDLPATIPAFRSAAPSAGRVPGGAVDGALQEQVVGATDEAAELLTPINLDRFYPRDARRRRIEGETVIVLALDAKGVVTGCTVAQSSPPAVFDAAADDLGRTLRFRPARWQGQPVASSCRLKLMWRLEGGP